MSINWMDLALKSANYYQMIVVLMIIRHVCRCRVNVIQATCFFFAQSVFLLTLLLLLLILHSIPCNLYCLTYVIWTKSWHFINKIDDGVNSIAWHSITKHCKFIRLSLWVCVFGSVLLLMIRIRDAKIGWSSNWLVSLKINWLDDDIARQYNERRKRRRRKSNSHQNSKLVKCRALIYNKF